MKNVSLTSISLMDEPGKEELTDLPEISKPFQEEELTSFKAGVHCPSLKEHAFSGTSVPLCSRLLGQAFKQQISRLHWFCAYQWT